MSSKCYIGGNETTLTELSDVVAIELADEEADTRSKTAAEFGDIVAAGDEIHPEGFEDIEEQLRAFAEGGWVIVRPTDEIRDAVQRGETPTGAGAVGRVFRTPGDRLYVVTDQMTVRLDSDLAETEAETVLGDAGFEIERKLAFAPNLYEVRIVNNDDPLELSVELHDDPNFVYAEPSFIEHIPGRSSVPQASFTVTPSPPSPDEEVTFDASPSSDPDGSITTYEWEFRKEPYDNPVKESGKVVTRSFSTGTYAVTLIITDNDGNTASASRTLEVEGWQPSDPDYEQQWQWENDGRNNGTVDADVDAEGAWSYTRGDGVRVGIIDGGFDIDHPDIEAAVDNAGYYQGSANSYTFVHGTNNFPNDGHGTRCAGMAIARANNGEGGVGMANESTFFPVALGQTASISNQTTLARAIAYAADPTSEVPEADSSDGADVISVSLGPNNRNFPMQSVLRDAIDFSVNEGRDGRGTPVFWATANGQLDIGNTDEVCSYRNTIAVGSSNNNDQYINTAYGEELDFIAPGERVYTTDLGGGYTFAYGTSYAAPLAAGVGALILATNPDLYWQTIRTILQATTDQVGGVTYGPDGHHPEYGYGRINARKAVGIADDVHTLIIRGTGDSSDSDTRYGLRVSGRLEPFGGEVTIGDTTVTVTQDQNDRVTDNVASGSVSVGSDGYLFTGEIESLLLFPESGATVYVDGEQRLPDETHTLVIDGVEGGSGARYELGVTGALRGYNGKLPAGDGTIGVNINESEEIGTSTAKGFVGGWADGYIFSGEIDSLSVVPPDEATVYVDGEQRSPDYPHTLVIKGVEGGPAAEYTLEVTGSLQGYNGRLPVGEGTIRVSIDETEEVTESSANGLVVGGADGYLFSGEIVELNISPANEAHVFIDGNGLPTASFEVTEPIPSPDEEITFDASSSSDPDGSITSYDWEFREKPSQNAESASGETVTRSFSEGEYAVTLTITDDEGATDNASKTLHVGEYPNTIVIEGTSASGGSSYEFAVSGDLLQVDGELAGHTVSKNPSDEMTENRARGWVGGGADGFRYSGDITEFTLDNPDQATVYVNGSVRPPDELPGDGENEPPIASFTTVPSVPNPGARVTFDAGESRDPAGSIVGYEWAIYRSESGTIDPEPIATLSGQTVTYSFTDPVAYTVELTVTDDSGATGTTSEVINVNAPPEAVFEMRPSEPAPGEEITFDASPSSDPDGSLASYRWEFIERPNQDPFETTSGVTVSKAFSTGTYAVRLIVTDNRGASDTDVTTLTVGNRPPTAAFDANPPDPAVNEPVTFDGGQSRDPDGSIASYDWEIAKDDSETVKSGTGRLLSYTFTDPAQYSVRLTVTDDEGATETTTMSFSPGIDPGAPKPEIQAPDSPVQVGTEVTLSGEPSTDPDGRITSYRWTVARDDETVRVGSGERLSVQLSEVGTYTVTLEVVDEDNITATTSISIDVTDSNQPPTAAFDITPSTAPPPGEEVTFDASVSHDPDGSITSYEWAIYRSESGTIDPEPIATLSGQTVTYSFTDPVVYSIHLTVRDDDGATATASELVEVIAAPVADFEIQPDSPPSGQEVTFDASSSYDPDGSIVSYEWEFRERPSQGADTDSGETVRRNFTSGEYAVTLTVTDQTGETATETKTLKVAIPPKPPVARFDITPDPPDRGEQASFDATGSYDPNGSVASYEWTIYRMGDGTIDPEPIATLSGQTVRYSFTQTGTHSVELTVTDDSGETDTTSKLVDVNAQPQPRFEMRPSHPAPSEEVTFDASASSDPDGSIVSYEWTFQEKPSQNAESATGKTVNKSFSAGTYAITLTITDEDGATKSTSETLEVGANQPPSASIDESFGRVYIGGTVTLDGSGSTDSDGEVVSYEWSVDPPSGTTTHKSGAKVTYDVDDEGTHQVSLTVTDDEGATDSTGTTFMAREPPFEQLESNI